MGCERYDGRISCVSFQISWLYKHIVKNRILSDSLLGTKLYAQIRRFLIFRPKHVLWVLKESFEHPKYMLKLMNKTMLTFNAQIFVDLYQEPYLTKAW